MTAIRTSSDGVSRALQVLEVVWVNVNATGFLSGSGYHLPGFVTRRKDKMAHVLAVYPQGDNHATLTALQVSENFVEPINHQIESRKNQPIMVKHRIWAYCEQYIKTFEDNTAGVMYSRDVPILPPETHGALVWVLLEGKEGYHVPGMVLAKEVPSAQTRQSVASVYLCDGSSTTASTVAVHRISSIITDFEKRRHHPKVVPIWDQFERMVNAGGPYKQPNPAQAPDPSGPHVVPTRVLTSSDAYADIARHTLLTEDEIAAFRRQGAENRKAIAETRAHLRETIDRLQWALAQQVALEATLNDEVDRRHLVTLPETTERLAIEKRAKSDVAVLKEAYDLATAVAKAKDAARLQQQAVKQEGDDGDCTNPPVSSPVGDGSGVQLTPSDALLAASPIHPRGHAPAPSPSSSSSSAFLHQVSSTFTCSRCGALVPIAEGPAHTQYHMDEVMRSLLTDVGAAERAALLKQRETVGVMMEEEESEERRRLVARRQLCPVPTIGVKREREEEEEEDSGEDDGLGINGRGEAEAVAEEE